MELKRDTWHFKLAALGNDYIKHNWFVTRPLDFCTYVRAVVKGALINALCFFLILLLGWCVVDLFLWLTVSLLHNWFPVPIGAAVTLGALFVASMLCVVFALGYTANKFVSVAPVREAYRGWKDKYCPIVKLD